MTEEALDKEQKFRYVIYHGHLHKIPIDDEIREIQEGELVTVED
ncbi:MAG: hypothetical protein ACFFE4_06150 [Candidatus Thorarchaeota archaeon]